MGFHSSRSGYTVRVDGLLLGETRFVIQGAVEYQAELSEAERDRLTPMAQLELMLAIEGERERGRRLGAETIRVGVVGDEPLYRLFRARSQELPDVAPRPETSASKRPSPRSRTSVAAVARTRAPGSRDRGASNSPEAPQS